MHGSIVTTQYVGINGVTISAINPNRSHNLAVAFNTLVDPDDTTDDDLVGPPTEDWDFGNLSDPVQVYGVLILGTLGDDIDGLV